MPVYDYRCNACKRRIQLTYKTYADYDAATRTCPRCGSTNLTRLISRVAIAKSDDQRYSDLGDESALDDMADADPATLARYMRRMSRETGEDLGDEFNEVVDRLERGEDPESIEAQMPSLADDADTGGAGGALDALE